MKKLRRQFLQTTVSSICAVPFATSFASAVESVKSFENRGRAKSCILIWLDGGPSHLETFDLKPNAPSEVRGPFSPIETSVSGIQISEYLPQTAKIMKKVAIIRSMTSPLGAHNFGAHYLLTGYKPSPVLEYPFFGSVFTHFQTEQNSLPQNIAIPQFRVGGGRYSGNGFLPATTQPFSLRSDPAKPDFQVRDLNLYRGVTLTRLNRRKMFLNAFDNFHQDVGHTQKSDNDGIDQAFRLTLSSQAKQAFDLSREPQNLRTRYGGRTIGQSCLMARRLIERGVKFVTVINSGWDTHTSLYTRLKEGYSGAQTPVGLIPSLDRAFSALITDLEERRLLDETLILVMGEFGRTPKLNTRGGRDHWPRVFSVAMAGGGIRGGQVVGSSDRHGESPKESPVTPNDLAATVYTCLGLDPAREMTTSDGRPVKISRDGKPITALLS